MSQSPLPKKEKKPKAEVQLSFTQAIHSILAHNKVTRLEWKNPEEYILLQDNFLRIHKDGKFHNLIVSEGDMLALDYIIL